MSKTKKKSQGFVIYIHRVLKQVHPQTGISHDALEATNNLLTVLSNRLAKKAWELTFSSEKVTVGYKEAQTAVKLLLPGELVNHGTNEGNKAVMKYDAFVTQEKEKEGKKGGQTKSHKAGLTVSVSLMRRILKGMGTGYQMRDNSSLRVGETASVYLAAVLEYILAEVMELSGNVARDYDRVRIVPRFILLAVNNDSEMKGLFDRLKVIFRRGGVVPHIEESLLPKRDEEGKLKKPKKKPKKKSKKKSDSKKSGRRFRPGTVALRKIRKLQKAEVHLRVAPFDRLVRTAAKYFEGQDWYLSKEFLEDIRLVTERMILRLLKTSLQYTIHCDRSQVRGTDVLQSIKVIYDLGYQDLPLDQRVVSKDAKDISENEITRLAYQAGIKLKTQDMITETRYFIQEFIHRLLSWVTIYTTYARKKTLDQSALKDGLSQMGYQMI